MKQSGGTNVAKWLAFSGSLLDTYREFHSIELPRGARGVSEVHTTGYALLARTRSNFAGAKLLVEQGLPVEARMLARACVENSFYVTALVKERDAFLKRMKSADIKSRDARSELILERHVVLADKRNNEHVDPKEVREFIKQIRKVWQNAKGIELRTLTKNGPLAGLYLIHAQLSSDAVHPSMESLSRYVKREGSPVKLQFLADLSNADLVDTL